MDNILDNNRENEFTAELADDLEIDPEQVDSRPGLAVSWTGGLGLAVVALVAGVLGYWLGYGLDGRQTAGPGTDSAEAGFARDMVTHHAQAVDMATLIRERSDDEDLRQIALDITLTQQGQIGQMQGWLST